MLFKFPPLQVEKADVNPLAKRCGKRTLDAMTEGRILRVCATVKFVSTSLYTTGVIKMEE